MNDLSTFHGWPQLPDELKTSILRLLLVGSIQIDEDMHVSHALGRRLTALIQTNNRKLADLALEIYYKENEFLFEVRLYEGDVSLPVPHPSFAKLIRRASVLVVLNSWCEMRKIDSEMLVRGIEERSVEHVEEAGECELTPDFVDIVERFGSFEGLEKLEVEIEHIEGWSF